MTSCYAQGLIIILFTSVVSLLTENIETLNEYVAEVMGGEQNAKNILKDMGFHLIRRLHGHSNAYQLKLINSSLRNISNHLHRVRRSADVISIQQQVKLKRTKRDYIHWNDEKYPEMWYLNRASNGVDADMNVQEAWQLGYSGKNVVVTIMDDGIDYTHPDLYKNYDRLASSDINGADSDPMPNITNKDNKHGTRCAGQVAAVGNNSICVVGVAFNAKIGGIRMLDGWITDRVEAESLSFHRDYIDIYSGSWGPDDTGLIYEGPGRLASEAFHKGATTGRKGLGNVYVWASGNGGKRGDSCAADGYASSIYTLSVSSVSEHNTRPWYLERCASTMISTYSSGGPSERDMVTTDLNHGCTTSHTGTSASAPLAVGIIALLLEANPRLTWRDVQYVTVLTANSKPFIDGNFSRNAAGHRYSYYYGFGLMDAGKLVRLGELWRTLPAHHRCSSNLRQLSRPLKGLFREEYIFNFSGCHQLASSGGHRRYFEEEGKPVVFLEHVQLYLTIQYEHRGLVRVTIISPSGTVSEVMPTRIADAFSEFTGIARWPLMTVQFWGEPAAGEWKVVIDNKEGFSQLFRSPNQRLSLDDMVGRWESVYIVVMGTETFPIRLRPPNPARPPPTEWFSNFVSYIVSENETFPIYYTCHNECATNECWGSASNQCLHGCKHVVSESGQCLSECPLGTTPLVSLMIQAEAAKDGGVRIRDSISPTPRCERCWSGCLDCLRPSSAYGCISCMKGTFLVPLLSPRGSQLRPDIVALMKNREITKPVHVGSCLAVCPQGYVANKAKQLCEQCEKNCDICSRPEFGSCKRCSKGYHLEDQRCLPGATPCPLGFFLQNDKCENCPIGCANSSCTRTGLCLYCSPQHRFMHEGVCRNSCPQSFYPGHLLTSMGLFALQLPEKLDFSSNIWSCSACPAGCVQCVSSGKAQGGFIIPKCLVCTYGLKFDSASGLCITDCSIGFYSRGCKKNCHPLCQTCFGQPSSCLTCSPGAYSLSTEILDNPLVPSIKPKRIHNCVVVCPDNMYEKQIDGERVCMSCPQMCQSCSGPDKCTTCTLGYIRNSNTGVCEITPSCLPNQYFNEDKMECASCHSSCARCVGPDASDCLECFHWQDDLTSSPACLRQEHRKGERSKPGVQRGIKYMVQSQVGTCMSCCFVNQLLEPTEPTDCMFCLPGVLTCASWASVGGGLGQFDKNWLDELKIQKDGWAWITNYPSHLVFFIIFVVFCIILIIIIYQVTSARCRKNRRRSYPSRISRTSTAHRLSQRNPDEGASPMLHANGFSKMHKVASAPTGTENGPGVTFPHTGNHTFSNPSPLKTQILSRQSLDQQPQHNSSTTYRKRDYVWYNSVKNQPDSSYDDSDEQSSLNQFDTTTRPV